MKSKPIQPTKEKEIDLKLKVDLTYDEINKYQAFYNDYFNAVDQQPIKLESLKELLISNVLNRRQDCASGQRPHPAKGIFDI